MTQSKDCKIKIGKWYIIKKMSEIDFPWELRKAKFIRALCISTTTKRKHKRCLFYIDYEFNGHSGTCGEEYTMSKLYRNKCWYFDIDGIIGESKGISRDIIEYNLWEYLL